MLGASWRSRVCYLYTEDIGCNMSDWGSVGKYPMDNEKYSCYSDISIQ